MAGYLDYYHKEKGYMLSFNFNKNIGVHEIKAGNKTIVEAVVQTFGKINIAYRKGLM